MKTRNEIISTTRTKIRLRHFAYSTEQSYCLERFFRRCRKNPVSRPKQIKAPHLAVEVGIEPASAFLGAAITALRCETENSIGAQHGAQISGTLVEVVKM